MNTEYDIIVNWWKSFTLIFVLIIVSLFQVFMHWIITFRIDQWTIRKYLAEWLFFFISYMTMFYVTFPELRPLIIHSFDYSISFSQLCKDRGLSVLELLRILLYNL